MRTESNLVPSPQTAFSLLTFPGPVHTIPLDPGSRGQILLFDSFRIVCGKSRNHSQHKPVSRLNSNSLCNASYLESALSSAGTRHETKESCHKSTSLLQLFSPKQNHWAKVIFNKKTCIKSRKYSHHQRRRDSAATLTRSR